VYRRQIVGESENGRIVQLLIATGRSRKVIRYAFLAVAATFIASCNSAPSQTPENAVGGANLVSSATAPFKTGTTSLTLDWGSKAKAGQFAIADVLSYGGPKPTINAPAGWLPICESSTKTTRQSLYGHAIQASDPSTPTWTFSEPVDAQGAILLLDNVAGGWAVDVSSCTAGENGTLTAKPVATTIDGDLILAFNATDFGAYRATACTGCGALNPTLPPDVSVVINQESTAREYWILQNYQNQMGETEPLESSAPQIYNWVAAQVAIKRGAAATPSNG
jgi:hypothetical protein